MLVNLAKRSASLLLHLMLDVYSIEGCVNEQAFRLLVADDGSTLSYIRSLVFPAGSAITDKYRISATKAPSLCEADADLVVVGANLLLADQYIRNGFYLVPKWVRLVLPVTGHPDEIIAKLDNRPVAKEIRRELRVMNERGYSYEVTNDPAWLRFFYDRMYKPHALKRYGDMAVVHKYTKLQKAFANGGAVVIKKLDKDVAGVVVSVSGNTLFNRHLGVIDGDDSIVKDGALRAFYYNTILLAHSRGLKYVDFGRSRPFLSDGVLKHKLKWQMDVKDDDAGIGIFAICSPRKSQSASAFMTENRFFHLCQGNPRLYDEALK